MSNSKKIFENSETKNQHSLLKNQLNSTFYNDISNFNIDNIDLKSIYNNQNDNFNLKILNQEIRKKIYHYLKLQFIILKREKIKFMIDSFLKKMEKKENQNLKIYF